jgi:2-methylcitrate dehydratase
MSKPLANRFAEYARDLRFEDLPAPVVHEVKRRFIDSFATAVGGMEADAFAIAKRCAQRVQGSPSVGLLGGGKAAAEWATFVNGLAIRYLDYNDTYLSKEPAHPSDNLAAVLSVGELTGARGCDLIVAAVLAYEIQCRLCDASSLRKNGFDHVTYGAISSCLAACKLMKLDVTRTTHAVGIAGVCNTALRQTRSGELSMWKGCAFANAARNGVVAAYLASEGMTGPAPIFEGDLGFMKLLTGAFEVAPMGAELQSPPPGTPPVVKGGKGGSIGPADFMISHTYIKFWPAEYHSQSSIDAALQLRPQIKDVRDIRAFDIYSFDAAVDIIGKDPEKWRPRTRETADHSLPYCTAVALLDGDVTENSFDDAHLNDPVLLELVGKIKIHRDAGLTARYPKGIPNRLVVTLADGRRLTKEVEFPRGHAGNPMTDAEVEHKFRTMVEPRYGKERTTRILAALWELDRASHADSLVPLFDAVEEDK